MKIRPIIAIFLLGSTLFAQAPSTPSSTAPLEQFATILQLVEENNATKVDPEKTVYAAIDGMLRTLDPHSRFTDPKAFAQMADEQRGRYYGLGITVTIRFGKLTVISRPVKGSPAEKADLRVGDVISKVNGEPTSGLSLDAAVSKIRGPRGTSVNISVARAGIEEPVEMAIVRDEIPRYTINSAFFIKPGIAYVKLDSFAETSGDELRNALRSLGRENITGLLLDLRGNPGGLLTAAIDISEQFLQRGQPIVETRGRTRGSNRTIASQRTNTENLFPLVVLVNSSSASASEIVSGALQDHDRALIVGEPSFGKGLVQSIYVLSNKSAVLLTTQKWYTPSGRLIQRDYSNISQFDYYNHRDGAEQKKDEVKHSDLGRIVYGGGGITPDYVEHPKKATDSETQIAGRFAFFTFAREFLAKNPAVDTSFHASDAMLEDFKKHLQKRNIAFTEKDIENSAAFIKRNIRFEVIYSKFGAADASRGLLDDDPQVLKAIDLIPEAKALADKAAVTLVKKPGN